MRVFCYAFIVCTVFRKGLTNMYEYEYNTLGINKDKFEIISIVETLQQVDIFIVKRKKGFNVCPYCGSTINHLNKYREKVLKHSRFTKLNCLIHLKQRVFQCNDCLKYFTEKNNFSSKYFQLTNETVIYILDELKKTQSFKDVADRCNITTQSVINVFEKYVNCPRGKLPEILCIDEFKYSKLDKYKYACVLLDHNSREIIDVIQSRRLDFLESYFNNIPQEEKKHVRYLVSDMYDGYKHLAGSQLPNATFIVDAFHYIRYVMDAFNSVRIRIQKHYNTTSLQYYLLKKYWKNLSKCSLDISTKEFYSKKLDRLVTNHEIIKMACNVDPSIKEAYLLKDNFLKDIRKTTQFDSEIKITFYINSFKSSTLPEFNKLASLFENWKQPIINSFIRDYNNKRYSNGVIEGMNSRIKTIKKVSYGYSNFFHFRNRIMYIVNDKTYISNTPKQSLNFYRKRRK